MYEEARVRHYAQSQKGRAPSSRRPRPHTSSAESSLLPGLFIWAAFKEFIAHHGNAGQEDAVLLEVYFVIPVAVQVAHQLLESCFISLFLGVEEEQLEARPKLDLCLQPGVQEHLSASGHSGSLGTKLCRGGCALDAGT